MDVPKGVQALTQRLEGRTGIHKPRACLYDDLLEQIPGT